MVDRSSVLAKLEGKGLQRAWVKAHLDYPHEDWCLIWPFASTGGATVQMGVEHTNVFRLMCEYRNGPPPTDKHQAAHSCGRRHAACVNPLHLSWKTNGENQKERFQHSGPQPRFKLTPAQVDEIRALEGRATVYDIAEQFKVSPNNIRSILAGKLWKNRRMDFRDWTAEEIRRILAAQSGAVGVIKGLAKEFGVTTSTIHRIKAGKSFRHLQEQTQ